MQGLHCAREKHFQTPTPQEPIKQDRNSTQLFRLLGVRQNCVAKICKASSRANGHKLQNDPKPCVATSRVQEDQSVTIGVLKSKK